MDGGSALTLARVLILCWEEFRTWTVVKGVLPGSSTLGAFPSHSTQGPSFPEFMFLAVDV